MGDYIIGFILLVIIVFAVRESIKHFHGEGSCCGGGSPTTKASRKKLKGSVLKTYTLSIEGMHCQNCVNNIERTINNIDGAVAKVNLRKGEAKIFCDKDIDIEQLKTVIEGRGYKVTTYNDGN